MEFSISDKMRGVLEKIRAFMEREIHPFEAEAGLKSFRQLLPELRKKRERVKEMGLWAPQVPVQYGGGGLGFMEHALVSEELGRSPFGHFVFG